MTSLLSQQEVNRAQVGPRELKDPRSRAYAIQTLYALKRYAESLRCDQERVATELAEIDRYCHWEVLGYPSREAMFAAELSDVGLTNIAKTERAVQAAEQAPKLAKPVAVAERTPAFMRDVRSGKRRSDNITPSTRGTSQSYLARRLLRDHPAIFDDLKAGAYTSVRAAAKAAGLVKEKTPLQHLAHWWKKASPDEQQQFLDYVTSLRRLSA